MGRPLSDTARAKMLAATHEIVRDLGPDAVTVDEVSRRSGVAKTTIYRHFTSGTALIVHAIDELVDSINPPDTGSLRGDLAEVVSTYLAMTHEPLLRRLFVAVLNRSVADPEFLSVQESLLKQRRSPLWHVLTRAQDRGEIDPEISAEVALDLVEGPFVLRRLVADQPLSTAEMNEMLDLIVKALSPRGP